MKSFVYAVAFLALSSVSLGAGTTTAKPSFTPKTPCGEQALACYTGQLTQLNTLMGQFNFNDGCKIYKTVFQCISNIPTATLCSPGSSGEAELNAAKQYALDDQGGICATDGTVTTCGNEVHGCLNDFALVLDYLRKKQAASACPLITKYNACADTVKANTACENKIDAVLTTVERHFDEFDLLADCDGPCARQVGLCTLNSTSFSLQQIGVVKYCQDSVNVVTCINNLKTQSVCSGSVADLTAADNAAKAQLLLVADICTTDGKVAPCAQGVVKCSEDMKAIAADPNASADVTCKRAAEFEECISRDPCTSDLQNLVQSMKQDVQTAEMQHNCPTAGSCSDRLKTCENILTQLTTADPTQTTADCKVIKKGLTCFDTVRSDPICVEEQYAVGNFESMVKKAAGSRCGGIMIKASIFLILITLIASFKNYL